jgi:hypothetical protein
VLLLLGAVECAGCSSAWCSGSAALHGAGSSSTASGVAEIPRVSSATGVKREASSAKGLMFACVAAALGVSAWLAGESTAGSAVAALIDGAAGASWLETAVTTVPMLTLLSPVLRLDPWLDAAVGAPAAVVKAPGSLAAAAAAWCTSVAS